MYSLKNPSKNDAYVRRILVSFYRNFSSSVRYAPEAAYNSLIDIFIDLCVNVHLSLSVFLWLFLTVCVSVCVWLDVHSFFKNSRKNRLCFSENVHEKRRQ